MKNNRKIAFLISGALLSSSIISPVDGIDLSEMIGMIENAANLKKI